MKYINFFLLLVLSLPIAANKPKIVGLVPVRNEHLMVGQCLKALSYYIDAIVVLDDASDDDTVHIIESLAQECKVEKIIKKEQWMRDEAVDRNLLLEAGRQLGGTHFIIIDADEMFTANCMINNQLRKIILDLQPGDRLLLNWIQLWKSINYYRFDKSVWTWNYKDFVFCDDGTCSYDTSYLHAKRTPHNLSGKTYMINGYTHGLLHFQFVNWRNLLIKQAWYRCLEHIREPEKPISDINNRYSPSKDESELGLHQSPSEWFLGYDFFDPRIFNEPEVWREKQILAWFEKYGIEHFADLDIWDIDWRAGLPQ